MQYSHANQDARSVFRVRPDDGSEGSENLRGSRWLAYVFKPLREFETELGVLAELEGPPRQSGRIVQPAISRCKPKREPSRDRPLPVPIASRAAAVELGAQGRLERLGSLETRE
jgi:hypothetical protein